MKVVHQCGSKMEPVGLQKLASSIVNRELRVAESQLNLCFHGRLPDQVEKIWLKLYDAPLPSISSYEESRMDASDLDSELSASLVSYELRAAMRGKVTDQFAHALLHEACRVTQSMSSASNKAHRGGLSVRALVYTIHSIISRTRNGVVLPSNSPPQ